MSDCRSPMSGHRATQIMPGGGGFMLIGNETERTHTCEQHTFSHEPVPSEAQRELMKRVLSKPLPEPPES